MHALLTVSAFFFRDVGDIEFWMTCTLNIGLEVVCGKPIAYKYVIHSPSRKDSHRKKYHPYEYFYNAPVNAPVKGRVNRCLLIPQQYCKPKGNNYT